ncbi:MAG TPA: lipid-A-disaccharide synthase [Longimicrobiales bacterium]|nr:lipid-A-disaccharide synthase [Longimicrobiales bacterium]
MSEPTILVAAGEPSGDLHGAAVAEALRRRWPQARLFGLGGPRMAAAGVELMADFGELAVMGFAEVASRLPFFVRLMRRLTAEMRRRGVDLVLPIDYPGFNLRLAGRARNAGVPVLYYIAPQVWAWHRSRIGKLAHLADRLAVILPFEEAIFREAGARVSFVGHPLLDSGEAGPSATELRAGLGVEAGPLLALFPGSRPQEVEKHLALFLEAAERLRTAHPDLQPVVARSPAVRAEAYAGVPYPTTADSRTLLRHARGALVKSGTTTLEAALAGTPMVIAYRTSRSTYALARRLVRVEHIGLVNLVAGRRLMPELVQDAATPAALAAALSPLLAEGSPERANALAGLACVRAALASPDAAGRSAAERVAALAAELIPEAR